MPTPVTESSEGGQHVEWSETFHAFLFRARIYLKRFWWILIFTIAAGVLVQAWKKHNSVTMYHSDAEMMVSMVSTGTGTAADYQENLNSFFSTQIHLMKSQEVLDTATQNVALQNPTSYGNGNPGAIPDASMYANTSILHLTAAGPDPIYTKLFLEQWMQAFLDKKKEMRIVAIQDVSTSIEEVAATYKKKLEAAQEDKRAFVEKNVIGTVQSEIDSATAKLNSLSTQISQLQLQLRILGWSPEAGPDAQPTLVSDLDKFKDYMTITCKLVDQVDGELASNYLLAPNPEYEQEKQGLVALKNQYDDLGVGLGTHHPKMVELARRITELENTLLAWRKQRVADLESNKADLLEQLRQDKDDQLTWNNKVLDDQKLQSQYQLLEDQVNSFYKIYETLIEGQTTLQENKDLGQDMLRINQHATDAYPIPDDPMKQIASGAFVGLAAGVAIIFLLGALDGRVMSVEDLTQRFDEPMLGVIPMQKRVAGQVELLKNNDQRQMFAESCRNIRSSLLYMDRQGQRPSVIMLTSSMPSEGKSTLSANLSITLGFASSKTLLVDADMRRGQLHKRFNIKNDFGLAEHIQDGLPLEKVIHPTAFENLDFIPCGQYPSNPGELLMSERFRESIATLRQKYDFVIFDSPPILLTDDAASFATRADAVLFVVRAGYTRLRQVRTSLESLNRRGVNVYGLIVNFIDHREPGYYSYRYYDYYSYRPSRTEKT
jgi:polysaccharide biosynthesis transport protein